MRNNNLLLQSDFRRFSKEICETLTESFMNDLLMIWAFPETETRFDLLNKIYKELLDKKSSSSVFYTQNFETVSLWESPEDRLSFIDMLSLGKKFFGLVGGKHSLKVIYGFLFIDSKRPKFPHNYLQALGTRPINQRMGFSSMLLMSLINDRERIPIYLETSNHDNVSFYKKFGFKTVCEFDVPFGGPKTWGMLLD